jgi:uncharacterized protein YkwD
MNSNRVWFCWLVLLLCSVQAPGQAEPNLSAQEKKLLELTNAERIRRELKPLQVSPMLGKVASSHAKNMAKQGKLEHVLDGKTPPDRLRDAGYRFTAMAENVAKMSEKSSMEQLIKMWMESKIHRENILNPKVTEIGLGIVNDGNGQVYYVQLSAVRE